MKHDSFTVGGSVGVQWGKEGEEANPSLHPPSITGSAGTAKKAGVTPTNAGGKYVEGALSPVCVKLNLD